MNDNESNPKKTRHACVSLHAQYDGRMQIYSVRSTLSTRTLCWRCFEHSLSAELTATAQRWLGSLDHSFIDSRQCSAPLLGWCSRQGGQNTWLHFSVTFTGWKSRKDCFVSLFWRTAVCMVLRRRTSSRPYNWCPTCLHVVIFGLPRCLLWSSCRPAGQHWLGDRTFSVAGARAPMNTISFSLSGAVPSLTLFRRCLKA